MNLKAVLRPIKAAALWGLNRGGGSIPKQGIIAYNPRGSLISTIGTLRDLQPLRFIQGPVELTHADLTPTCNGTKSGTAQWDRTTAGKFVLDAGTMWDASITFEDSTVSTYPGVASALTATTGIVWDSSGYGRHLLFTVADSAVVCGSGTEFGSDTLNFEGFSTDFSTPLSAFDNSNLSSGEFYVENVAKNKACYSVPSGIANYTDGAYKLICSGALGDTVLTITGGDNVNHAGTGIWKCVIEYQDGELEFNIVDVVSNPTCTLVYPLKKAGPVNVWAAWQSATGQHYSLKGVQCYAESLFRMDGREAVRDESVFSIQHADYFSADPWVKLSPQIWQPTGGIANNQITQGCDKLLNPFTTGKRLFAAHRRCTSFTSTAAGHGLILSVPLTEVFTGRIELETGVNAESGFSGAVVVTANEVQVYSQPFGTYLKKHIIRVTEASSLTISVARTTSGSTSAIYIIGSVHLIRESGPSTSLINVNSKILLCGDSWLDTAHSTGVGFKQRLDALITSVGGTGVVIDGATQGMTTAWALKWLPYYLAQHSPQICIINFFTNDNNNLSGQTFLGPDGQTYNLNVNSHSVWAANIKVLAGMCKTAGCIPIIMLPDTTSSESQSIIHMDMSIFAGQPVLTKEWLTQATTSELALATFVGNTRNKTAGRAMRNISTSVDLAASAGSPSDPWIAKPASVLMPIRVDNLDSLGNSPLYPGQARYDITSVSHPSDTSIVSGHTYSLANADQIRKATGWTFGTANDFYDAAGVPLVVDGATILAFVSDMFFTGPKGTAAYSTQQSLAKSKRINAFLKALTITVLTDEQGNVLTDEGVVLEDR